MTIDAELILKQDADPEVKKAFQTRMIQTSLIHQSTQFKDISCTIDWSVIGSNVTIGSNVKIINSVVLSNVVINDNEQVENSLRNSNKETYDGDDGNQNSHRDGRIQHSSS